MVRIGIDIGGAFTDLWLVDAEGYSYNTKLLTTPEDPAEGFLEILRRAFEADARHLTVDQIVHATTVATNSMLERVVAQPLSMTVEQAAEGIVALANAQMVQALQLVSVRRGLDPRQFLMVAFGGAGPMHAAELARQLGCPRVIIPPEAGVPSAWGLLGERQLSYYLP